jgi:ribosomal protein L11 methyltransferase
VPYRLDVADPPADAFDTLVHLGALDVESIGGGLAAIMPDTVSERAVASALGVGDVQVSRAVGRDDDSVWMLTPRAVRVGSLVIVPSALPPAPGALRIADGPAFGTGLHPTTALCLEAIEELVTSDKPEMLLDVGTGSAVLALAALRHGVRLAVGLDIDPTALAVAGENARLNDLRRGLLLVRGTLESICGSWLLIVANIRAAELMAMAPAMVRRIASRGVVVLSGIPCSVADDVESAYRRLGMRSVRSVDRDGWTALVLRASW